MATLGTAPSPSVASTDTIRTHFPALKRHYNGFSVAYFDGPGGTQAPLAVGEAMTDYLYHHNANTHWAYPTSAETDVLLDAARHAAADFLNATPTEVVFGNNMTTLTFHLARALGRSWQAGDEIIVTDLDHHANIDPWRDLAAERSMTIHAVRMDTTTGQLDWDHFGSLLGPRTRLVAIGAASNALGTINDVRRATERTRAQGALSFIDAVHYAPHALVDVRAIGCDFLACSPYKFYGPHAGILFGRRDLLNELPLSKVQPASDVAPENAETGTQNHEAIVGTAAAIDFLASLAEGPTRRARLEATFDALHQRGTALVTRLWEGLSTLDDVTLYGPPPNQPRTPTVAFTVNDLPAREVCRHLAQRGLFLSHGDFYASTVVKRLGVEGLIRAGAACYTTEQEVDRLVEGVRAVVVER